MGDANRRGTPAERKAAAQAMLEQMRPDSIPCDHCRHEIKDLHLVPLHERHGLEVAFSGECPQCQHTTYLLKGSKQALNAFAAAMTTKIGSTPSLSVTRTQNRSLGVTE